MLIYVLGIVAALGVLGTVVELLRRNRLRERHAAWWLGFGLIALANAVFPSMLDWFARLVGVEIPANLAFFVALVTIFLVALQLAGEITHDEERSRELVEKIAMLEMRVRELEDRDTSDR